MKKADKDLDPEEAKLVSPARDLQKVAKVNRESEDLLTRDRLSMMSQLQGKAVFID